MMRVEWQVPVTEGAYPAEQWIEMRTVPVVGGVATLPSGRTIAASTKLVSYPVVCALPYLSEQVGQHGPWEHEMGAACPVCGVWRLDLDEYSHATTEGHLDAEFATLTEADWAGILEDIDRGLGWADSEGAGSGRDAWISGMLRRMVASLVAQRPSRA